MGNARLGQWAAIALAICGAAIPPLVATVSPAINTSNLALWNGFGLLFLLAAFVLWESSGRTGVRQRLASWEPVIQQMRGTSLRADQTQRHVVEIEKKASEIDPLRQLLNEERHNLSLIASGMVEIRGILDTERTNLGALAAGVHEVRTASEQRDLDMARFSAQVGGFNEIVVALRTHLDGLSSNLARLDEQTIAEQRNLGLVAAGLDTVRRSASGSERFAARQDAFEDALVAIADRIDALDAAVPDRDVAA